MQKIVLGTRGSELALTQARLVEAALKAAHGDEVAIETKIVRTSGDERASNVPTPPIDPVAGRKGMFTREIERALLAGEVDVAVHSAKDLPSQMTDGLAISAVLPRANVDDLFIAKTAANVMALPAAAVVATGSVRRKYQLLMVNPALNVVDLRGNVPTRLRKLAASDWHGVVLARAGLERLGLSIANGRLQFDDNVFEAAVLPRERFVPAGGQGIIALQIRTSDDAIGKRLAAVNDAPALACLRAEREFLRLLNGDCNSPVGVFAAIDSGIMRIDAQVFEKAGGLPRAGRVEVPADISPESAAGRLMEKLNVR